jgi:hypothetical protein
MSAEYVGDFYARARSWGIIDGQLKMDVTEGIWTFDRGRLALIAILQDPVHMSELLFEDPNRQGLRRVLHRGRPPVPAVPPA